MENIHNLKECPWITQEPIKIKEYFDRYQQSLDNLHGRPYHEKACKDGEIKSFFPDMKVEPKGENPFDLEKLAADCSVDLLTVQDELAPEELQNQPLKHSGRITNWFSGTFQDGVIPARGIEVLDTLKAQAHELHLRQNVRDYSKLQNRNLKYFSTVRMISESDSSQVSSNYIDDTYHSQRDIVINVRVQRPFHKKTHLKKACNRFPKHSQELLFLGSQKLTVLRDHIVCINDLAVNQDLSADPQLYHLSHLPNNAREFPSGFFYINGVIYDDMRHSKSKRYSEDIINWAKNSDPDIGKIECAVMEETKFEDLELRLGYPYVYLHQGNCEHIIVFTDIRLHHQEDVQDVSRYPLQRGQATKLFTRCYICNLCLANWIVKDDPRIMVPHMHVCDSCLKLLFYNHHGKINDFKVFPFIDEFLPQQKNYYTAA